MTRPSLCSASIVTAHLGSGVCGNSFSPQTFFQNDSLSEAFSKRRLVTSWKLHFFFFFFFFLRKEYFYSVFSQKRKGKKVSILSERVHHRSPSSSLHQVLKSTPKLKFSTEPDIFELAYPDVLQMFTWFHPTAF